MNSTLIWVSLVGTGLTAIAFIFALRTVLKISPFDRGQTFRLGYAAFPDSILLELAESQGLLKDLPLTLRMVLWNRLHESLEDSSLPEEDRLDIAYTNRKIAMRRAGKNDFDEVKPDESDLAIYKGFAILYWPGASNSLRPYTDFVDIMGGAEEAAVVATLAQLFDKKIYASGGTDHAANVQSLLKKAAPDKTIPIEMAGDPQQMLVLFEKDRTNTCFVGGLTQRIVAVELGAEVLISQDQVDLGLKIKNCFSYRTAHGEIVGQIVDLLNLRWRETAQRLSSPEFYAAYRTRLGELLEEAGADFGKKKDAFDLDELIETIWHKWFEIPGATLSFPSREEQGSIDHRLNGQSDPPEASVSR